MTPNTRDIMFGFLLKSFHPPSKDGDSMMQTNDMHHFFHPSSRSKSVGMTKLLWNKITRTSWDESIVYGKDSIPDRGPKYNTFFVKSTNRNSLRIRKSSLLPRRWWFECRTRYNSCRWDEWRITVNREWFGVGIREQDASLWMDWTRRSR